MRFVCVFHQGRIFLCIWLFLWYQKVDNFYSSKGAEVGPDFEVIFNGDEVFLEIPKNGITLQSGWTLLPLVYPTRVRVLSILHIHKSTCLPLALLLLNPSSYLSLQLLRERIDDYQPGKSIPSCQVELDWTKDDGPPKKLDYALHLRGVNPPETYIRIIRNPKLLGQKKNIYACFLDQWWKSNII